MTKDNVRAELEANREPIDGELFEVAETNAKPHDETIFAENLPVIRAPRASAAEINTTTAAQKIYLVLPALFLTVSLLGGLRFQSADNSFIFLKPALVCLIFAVMTLFLFVRAGLIKLDGWLSEEFTGIKNAANAAVLITLFAASAQMFNSLLPERGLPFWIVAFCFLWTLWNNIFAAFDAPKLIKSLGATFALAFAVKYLILANITAPASESWWRGFLQNPAQETLTYLLDLSAFSAATGYVQFFAVIFYLLGLFLLPDSTRKTVRAVN